MPIAGTELGYGCRANRLPQPRAFEMRLPPQALGARGQFTGDEHTTRDAVIGTAELFYLTTGKCRYFTFLISFGDIEANAFYAHAAPSYSRKVVFKVYATPQMVAGERAFLRAHGARCAALY